MGTIKETGDHRSGQRTQTEGVRRRVREIEIDDREGGKEERDGVGTEADFTGLTVPDGFFIMTQ